MDSRKIVKLRLFHLFQFLRVRVSEVFELGNDLSWAEIYQRESFGYAGIGGCSMISATILRVRGVVQNGLVPVIFKEADSIGVAEVERHSTHAGSLR